MIAAKPAPHFHDWYNTAYSSQWQHAICRTCGRGGSWSFTLQRYVEDIPMTWTNGTIAGQRYGGRAYEGPRRHAKKTAQPTHKHPATRTEDTRCWPVRHDTELRLQRHALDL